MATPTDPVAFRLVQSLARPGGNITGLSQMLPELMGKRLGLLKEIMPGLSRVGVLWNPAERASLLNQRAAPAIGLQLQSLEARSFEDLDKKFEEAAKARVGAISITPEVLYTTNVKRLADIATAHRLPTVYHLREYADAGGLLAYGPDRFDLYRRAAAYVDRILKGMKPSELPIEQPTKFELVLNQRTANTLGITVPSSVLVRADAIIE
jgi:putative ABC transport system substrate-binding protein